MEEWAWQVGRCWMC